MGKEAFIKELEYLLSDIPEEEKREALDYYRDYLEEAGPEREEEVLREFESPERIASIIRVDLAGGMENAGEFTDSGYTDQRFENASYPVPGGGLYRTQDEEEESQESLREKSGTGHFENQAGDEADRLREETDQPHRQGKQDPSGRSNQSGGPDPSARSNQSGGPDPSNQSDQPYQDGGYAKGGRTEKRRWGFVTILLTAALICVAAPLLFSAGIGVFGLLAGLAVFLTAGFLALGVVTIAGFFAGICLLIVGVFRLTSEFWVGLMCVGLGMTALGAGCFLLLVSYLFYGRLLPWLAGAMNGLWKRIVGEKKKTGEKREA